MNQSNISLLSSSRFISFKHLEWLLLHFFVLNLKETYFNSLNKPKGLKVAKEDQMANGTMADRLDIRCR